MLVNGIDFRKQGDHYAMYINGEFAGTCATVSEGLYDLRKEEEEAKQEETEDGDLSK